MGIYHYWTYVSFLSGGLSKWIDSWASLGEPQGKSSPGWCQMSLASTESSARAGTTFRVGWKIVTRSPSSVLSLPFFGWEGFPTTPEKKSTLVRTSLLEDLGDFPRYPRTPNSTDQVAGTGINNLGRPAANDSQPHP